MEDLNVRLDSWHYRLYQWAVDFWFDFTQRDNWNSWYNGHSRNTLKKVSNLCFYMRVILVWAPLVVVMHLLVLLAVWITFVTVPISLFGSAAWLSFLAVSGIILAGFAVGVVVLYYLIQFFPTIGRGLNKIFTPVGYGLSKIFTPVGHGATSFFSLFWEFLKTNKKKICPTINILELEEREA